MVTRPIALRTLPNLGRVEQDEPADPAVPAQPSKTAAAINAVKSLPAKLSGLNPREKMSSALAHAQEKMRHRRRDFAAPFVQNSKTGAPIGPPDVARPRYALRTHADIHPATAPAAPTRIQRYDAQVKHAAAGAHNAGTSARHPPSFSATLSRQAARGEPQLRDFIKHVLPARDDAPAVQAGGVLPAAANIGGALPLAAPADDTTDFAADMAAAFERVAGAAAQPAAAPAVGAVPAVPAGAPASALAHRLDGLAAQAQLTTRLAALGAPPGAGPTSYGSMIVTALRNVGIGDPRMAEQVSARMQTLSINDIVHGGAALANDPTTRHALLAMRNLSRGGRYSFEALGALRTAGGQPFANGTEARAVHALLSATDHMASLPGADADALPAGIAAQARRDGPPGSEFALEAFDAATHLLDHGEAAMNERQKHMLFAWRQGDRSEAAGTEASKKNHRLQKFTRTSIPRVAASRLSRAITAPKRMLGMNKSPVTASTLGLGGVPRDTLKKEQNALKVSMQAALTALTAVPEAVPAQPANPVAQPQVEGLATGAAGGPPAALTASTATPAPTPVAPLSAAAALTHADPVGSLVELAGLHVWLQAGGFPTGRIEPDELRQVAHKAVELSADAPADVRERLAAFSRLPDAELRSTQPFRSLAHRHFSIDLLEKWGTVARLPKGEDSPFWHQIGVLRKIADKVAPVRADKDSTLSQQVDILRKVSSPPEKKLETRSVEAARELLVEVASSLKSGSRLRLSDGHHFGGSTRGVSVTLSNLIHAAGVPLSVQANLRAIHAKDAVVELARSTHGIEIFIGTAERLSTHVEGGVFAGYKFDMGLAEARAGGALNVVFHSGDRGNSTGVTIGIERPVKADGSGYDDRVMLEKAANIVASLFDEAAQAEGEAVPASASEHVFARYFDDPGVSAAWTDTRSSNHSSGASLTGSLTVRPPESIHHVLTTDPTDGSVSSKVERSLLPVGIGPSIGIASIHDYRQKQESPGGDGAIQVEQHRRGGGSRLIGRLGLGLSASIPVGKQIYDKDGKPNGRLLGLGVLSLDTPSWNITFRNTRMSARLQLVRNGAQLNHRACSLDREFASASAYIEAVESERDKWVHLFAAETTPAGQAPDEAAIRAAHEKVDEHLSNARANWRPSQTLFTRHRLREHAARALDLNQALHEQMQPCDPDDPEVIALADANARILDDPESYMPIELKGRETTGSDRSYGPNVLLHLGTRKAMSAQREFVADNVSFTTMDRVDREMPVPAEYR